ncbi:hypothetical protein BJ165DRAFT_1462530 [Panaeolus papilionaceus]|nr:hypothetical protein BJ165DRAFT_1462530 [Panaeolus papilionaceus]
MQQFMQVTNAYRTLVREGYLRRLAAPMGNSHSGTMPAHRPPPPMAHKNSSESSISLDSFIHLVASSQESLTTAPPPSHRENSYSSWSQGVRQPPETVSSQYRNPHIFNYDLPPRDMPGPAGYRPSLDPGLSQKLPASVKPISRPFKGPPPPHFSGDSLTQKVAPPYTFIHPQPSHSREEGNLRSVLPPNSLPLISIGLGPSGEWVYSLSLSLEEIFEGKHCRFGITRSYLSKTTKNIVIELDIPAGCRPGTRILCRNVGHEWKPGIFQDIAFIIEEEPHDRFVRLFDDLIMDVRIPWVDKLRQQGGKVPLVGIDGRNLVIQIDTPKDRNTKGRSVVQGAGMPIRERGKVVGRGNLVVQWEILPPQPKMFHFVKRLWRSGK